MDRRRFFPIRTDPDHYTPWEAIRARKRLDGFERAGSQRALDRVGLGPDCHGFRATYNQMERLGPLLPVGRAEVLIQTTRTRGHHPAGDHMNHSDGAPIRLAGRTLTQKRHVCAFFNSREEQNKLLIPFFKEGIDRGEKVLRIMDPRLRDEYLSAYRAGGIDVEAAEKSGQLEIRHWHDTYLQGGCFDGDKMIRLLEEGLEENRKTYGLTRASGNMEWALEPVPGVTDIIEYEAKLNYVVAKYPDPLVCVYDLNRHSASVVMDILRTHPMVIVGGVLQDNPLYVPPEEFLQELERRKCERRQDSLRGAEQPVQ